MNLANHIENKYFKGGGKIISIFRLSTNTVKICRKLIGWKDTKEEHEACRLTTQNGLNNIPYPSVDLVGLA